MHNRFHEEDCWVVEWISSSRFFMKALRTLMPENSIVYLSSYDDCSEFLPFVVGHRCAPDMVEPVFEGSSEDLSWIEHLAFGEPLIASIEDFFGQWNFPYAHHVHGYRDGSLIFWFHDAFRGGDLEISSQIDEDQIAQFCGDMAPKFRRRAVTQEVEQD